MIGWGVETFKIYVGTSRRVGEAVIKEAHRRGKWVTAHLAWNYRAQDAVADGIDSLEHIDSIFEFILPPETPRWPAPAERVAIPPAQLADLQRRILEVKTQVDFSASAALTAATRNNARSIGQTAQLGSLEPGKRADIVILDANPLQDIKHTRKSYRVIRSGLVGDPVSILKTVPAR